MRQFDLVENPSARSRAVSPYFVILQSHHLRDLGSVVVAPLLRDVARPMTILDVQVEISGEKLVVALGEIFSIEQVLLRERVGSIAAHEDLLRRAFDRLFTGF